VHRDKVYEVSRPFYESSMLLQRATLDPNLSAFGQTTGDGAGTIPSAVKRGVRRRYENKCAFCGEDEYSDAMRGVQPKLSCAHLAPRAGYFQEGFANNFDVNSLRNFILLCGSHGRKGTCHYGFDSHKLALIPDVLGQAQGWKVLRYTLTVTGKLATKATRACSCTRYLLTSSVPTWSTSVPLQPDCTSSFWKTVKCLETSPIWPT
ncbi:unnamed protein product, partial [Symbiodinium sp. CCMP2592]